MRKETTEWRKPRIEDVGDVAEIVRESTTGKTLVELGDSGESQKNSNNEPS